MKEYLEFQEHYGSEDPFIDLNLTDSRFSI